MNKMFALAAAAACVVAMSGDANAFQRHSTFTGPNGNSRSVDSAGSCSGGTCSYNRTVTGPRGGTRTRSGSASNTGGGASWQRGGTATGPNGNTVIYGGSGSCSGGTCSYQGGASGPNGSVSHSGTVSRY
jgi:hypothetical protein